MSWIKRLLVIFFAGVMLMETSVAEAKDKEVATGFINKVLAFEGTTYRYVVYVPWEYTPQKRWPVILFLHGAGERGTDGLKQTEVGIGRAIRLHSERFPALVVMPQCAPEQWWAGKMNEMALKALDQTLKEYSCDENRLYLTGLSMGGFGCWNIVSEYPDKFAAVVPICGGGDPEKVSPKLKSLPIWVFHGAEDKVVPPERSRVMVEAVKSVGNTQIRYTEYEGVGHNSWDKAYEEKELIDWLFSQKRGGQTSGSAERG